MPESISQDFTYGIESGDELFSDRLEFLLRQRGCTKAWLAKKLGLSRQAFNQILKHSKKSRFVTEISLIFNVNPIWLESGSEQMYINKPSDVTLIPIYNLAEILTKASVETATCIDTILFRQTSTKKNFAVLFKEYPSMSDKFEENSILIFDQVGVPKNGQFILVNLQKKGVYFRHFSQYKNDIILKPLNPSYDIIVSNEYELLGILSEVRIKF